MQRRRSRSRTSLARPATAILLVAVVVSGTTPAGGVIGPQRILAGPADQLLAAVNATYLIWTQNSEAFPNRYHAYGRLRGTSEVFRLNPPGTRGYTGGIDPDEDRAIYQQIDGAGSDLFTIDLDDLDRRKLPPIVNTDRWEWGPRISNRFVLFARDAASRTSVFLYHRVSKTIERLASLDFTKYYVSPGSVGERYATWSVCGPLSCNAFIRDTQAQTTRKIPSPDGKARYAPVVDEVERQVYFARSGPACGASVRIMRLPVTDLTATPVTLVTLPAGIDVGYHLWVIHVAGQVDLWFTRHRCDPQQGDVYRLRDVGAA